MTVNQQSGSSKAHEHSSVDSNFLFVEIEGDSEKQNFGASVDLSADGSVKNSKTKW